MSYTKVSLGFERRKDYDLKNDAVAVLEGMTGNAHFPDPLIPLSVLAESVSAFSTALGEQKSTGPSGTALKDDARQALITNLIRLGSYVQFAANGDRAILLTSGFKAIDGFGHHPSTPIEIPSSVRALNAGNGRLALKFPAVKRARSYQLRYRPADASPDAWESRTFTNSRNIIVTDLTPGVRYTFQVRAVGGSEGLTDWSDPTSHMSL